MTRPLGVLKARKTGRISRSGGPLWVIDDTETERVAYTVWLNEQGAVTHVWGHSYRDRYRGTVFEGVRRADTCLWRAQDHKPHSHLVGTIIRMILVEQEREDDHEYATAASAARGAMRL